jgi:hypothetical protein
MHSLSHREQQARIRQYADQAHAWTTEVSRNTGLHAGAFIIDPQENVRLFSSSARAGLVLAHPSLHQLIELSAQLTGINYRDSAVAYSSFVNLEDAANRMIRDSESAMAEQALYRLSVETLPGSTGASTTRSAFGRGAAANISGASTARPVFGPGAAANISGASTVRPAGPGVAASTCAY